MKIRTDFVSNSSSASFIVNSTDGGVKLLCEKMAELFNSVDVPYQIDDKIDISISVKNKWYKEVFETLKPDEKCSYSDFYTDWSSKKLEKKDPEEVSWDSIKISAYDLKTLIATGIVDKIDHLYFSSADENDDICNWYLATFFKFFDAIDCNPDASGTERNFLGDEDNDFLGIMHKMTEEKCIKCNVHT